MTWLDKYLQNWRIRKVLNHISGKVALLDIGCHQGELLLKAKDKISIGIGIDPQCSNGSLAPNLQLVKGMFPAVLPRHQGFDFITALAVLEHIPLHEQATFLKACFEMLNNNGTLILTVPDAKVDYLLKWLTRFKLVSGMSLEQHFGFDIHTTPLSAKNAGFELALHQRFQLGLNNLFVFSKTTLEL